MNTEMKELNPEMLEKITGGYIHYNESAPDEKKWEVIDKQGNVVYAFNNKEGAQFIGRNFGWTDIELTDEQIKRIWGE